MTLLHQSCKNQLHYNQVFFGFWISSVDLREELDLLTQMLFQPRQYLEQVNVEVSSIRRLQVTPVPSLSYV